ncbi:MAG: hypothetical protein WC903_01275 [Candidatus Margulisiibacteriota bacterium]
MNSKDVVVRIIQPADKAQPPKRQAPVELPPAKNHFQLVLNAVALAAIAALGLYFIISFFHLGIGLKDIVVMVGLPLSLAVFTSYALL